MTFSPNRRTGRVITAAALLPAILFAVSSHATSAAENAAQAAPKSVSATSSTAPAKAMPIATQKVDRVEARITDLRKKLLVTTDQQVLWNDVAQVMRENEKKMREVIEARSTKMKSMNAVDDLRSYRMITDEHADGLKRLVPAFEALYAKMTPAQQKNADHVFDEQQRRAPRKS